MRWALARKSGSRMKIQDWYGQGLSASWRSQRRTVDGEMVSVTPRAVSSAASSGHDQRASGTPVSAGGWQARALASATCTGVKRAGRPMRRRSARAGRRRRTGPSRCARCPRALPPRRRSGRWTCPGSPGAGSVTGPWPGAESCDRRPPSSTVAARRPSGLWGGRQELARQAGRSAVVDQSAKGGLLMPSRGGGGPGRRVLPLTGAGSRRPRSGRGGRGHRCRE